MDFEEECNECIGGAIPNCQNSYDVDPPKGFVIVQRCDCCHKFETDLDAAEAWGDLAHWQWVESLNDQQGHTQAIAKPRKRKG